VDNLLEYIIPIVFAAIYFFGNMLSKNSDDGAAPSRPRQEDPDVAERQRQIQAEIRRKIMERRSAAGSTGEGGATSAPRERGPSFRPELAERSRQASTRHHPEQVKGERGRHSRPESVERTRPEPVERSRQSSDSARDAASFDNDIQAKLQQIEATKRRAEKLKKQARASNAQTQSASASPSRRSAFRGPVRSTLRDPAAARTAFIYGEVLGPPISQRKSQTVPGLA
jgi:hypothetical protein